MIIFLYGPDEYRREQKKNELIAVFQKKHSGLGLGHFDAADGDSRAAFLNFLENQSMFEPAKLAVLRNAYETEDKEFVKRVQAAKTMPGVSVLVSETDIPPKAFAFLRKEEKGNSKEEGGSLVQKFEHASGAEWRAFLKREAKEREAELEPEALEFLARAYEKDAWRAVTELQKLALLGRKATRKDLETMSIELAPNFWATMNALKSPRVGERLNMLERMLARSEPAAKIFNILSAQWPDRISMLAKYDAAVKSGKCEYEEILVDLVLS